MTNLFSTDAFLLAAAEICHPGEHAEVVTVAVADQRFRLLRTDGQLRTDLPFYDFVEPEPDATPPVTALAFLPTVCIDSVAAAEWPAVAARRRLQPAPWVDWRKVDDFTTYVQARRQLASRAFSSERKARRLERELGPVRLELAAADRTLIDRCAAWKSAQYRKTEMVDLFASGRVQQLFHRLFDAGLLTVSVLYAGERPVAIHLGAILDGRFYSWVPAYDADASAYSPGVLLLERLLAESHRLRHREFDFLIGGEPYKFYYATDVRLIAPLGTPPLRRRMWGPLRQRLLAPIRRWPGLYATLQRAKRWYRQHRLP